MASQTEDQRLGDFLKFEEDNRYSRVNITILAGSGSARVLKAGTVLAAKTAADDKYEQLVPAGADGSEVAAGVLLFDTEAADGVDGVGVMVGRARPGQVTGNANAIVSSSAIIYPGGITAPQTQTAVDQLELLGIRVREGI